MIKPIRGSICTRSPTEWTDLWKLVKENPFKWIRTTAGMYRSMLGSVPPRAYCSNGFLMGEPNSERDGEPTWYCFIKVNGQVLCREVTYTEFKAFEAGEKQNAPSPN